MKYFIIIFLSLFLSSCQAQKIDSKNKNVNYKLDNCLDDGACTVEILYNSELEVKTDEFGNTYPKINIGDNMVVKYQYKKNEIENVADSSYSEIILFELNNDKIDLHLQNGDLQEVKLLFGRLCFCRGATGYYRVEKGDLKVNFDKDKLKINLQFKVDKVPQKISNLTEVIPLK